MHKTAATLQRIISSAHRAIWRLGITMWLLALGHFVTARAAHKPFVTVASFVIITYLGYLAYEAYNIIREYRHPRPGYLGISETPRLLAICLLINLAVITFLVWPFYNHEHLFSGWPWLLLVWAGAFIAYLMRPKALKESVGKP